MAPWVSDLNRQRHRLLIPDAAASNAVREICKRLASVTELMGKRQFVAWYD
jgi:hypothetical protein